MNDKILVRIHCADDRDSVSYVAATAIELYRTTQALQRALAENQKLREALEYYADADNYEDQDNSCGDPECCGGPWPFIPVVDRDGGDIAREALGIED